MKKHPDEHIMQSLIELQRTEHSIIAAIIDPDHNIVAIGKTRVLEDHDPTAHAEVNAIRKACKLLKKNTFPKGYWIYSTFEPCPLCSAAIIWSELDGVVYSNNPTYRGNEQNWSFISCAEVLQSGAYIHEVVLEKDFLIDEIKDYFI